LALWVGIELLPERAISQSQSPWTAIQVTVSKQSTFWNRSLASFGVGKVSDILLFSIMKPAHKIQLLW
jgi:hypothetical protein